MSDDLHAKLIIDIADAMKSVDDLSNKLQGALKPKAGNAGFGKDFKESIAFIRAEAVKLGRDMDVVNAKFGSGSKESLALAASLKSTAGAYAQQKTALRALADQYKNGELSTTQFKTGVINLQSAIRNLNNKLSGSTPIRAMQKDIQGLSGSLGQLVSTALPGFGRLFTSLGQIKTILNTGLGGTGAVFSTVPDAVSGDQLNKLLQYRAQIAGLGTDAVATGGSFGVMAAGAAAAVGTLAVLATAIAAVATASSAIKVGAEFEAMEYQMAAMISSSTKFKDETTGAFVDMQKNLELSLAQSKQIIANFVRDSPKLAGTNLKELTETASVTLGRLASVGITDPEQQTKLIESMTVAIKTVTAGQQNAGVQLAQESRALLAGEFKATNTLINQLAVNAGGKDRFKALFDEAKKAGKLGEFLEAQLKPYLAAANYASQSFGNLNEILTDFVTNTLKAIADSGTFNAAKEAFKGLLSPIINFDQASFGSVKQTILDLAGSIGTNLAAAINALAPILPAVTTLMLTLAAGMNGVLAASLPLLEAIGWIQTAAINLITTLLEVIGAVLQPLGDAFIILSQIILNEALIPIMDGLREFSMVGQSTSLEAASQWQMLGEIMHLFSQAAVLMVSDYSAGMSMLQSVTAAAGSYISSVFQQMSGNVLNSIGDMVSKAAKMLASLAGPLAGIVGSMGGKLAGNIKGFAGKLLANAGTLKASASASIATAKSFKIPATQKTKNLLDGFKGFGAPQIDSEGKKKKGGAGSKGPADKSAQIQKADNETENAKEQLSLAKEMAATDERINKIKETQAKLNAGLAAQERGLEAKKDNLAAQEKGLSLEQKKINLAFETGRMTASQKLEAEKQIAIKKVEIDYQQQLVQIDLKRIELQKELNNLNSERMQRAEGIAEANSKLETVNKQIAAQKALNNELVRNTGESDQAYELRAEQNTKKVVELEKAAVQAKGAVDNLLSGDKQANTGAEERIEKIKSEIQSLSQAANDNRKQALEEVNIDAALNKRNANTFGNSVRDAGRNFVLDIAQGMKSGDGFLGAVISAGEKFVSTISDNMINLGVEKMFKGGNPFAGFMNGGGGAPGAPGQAGGKGAGGLLSKFAGLGALGGPMGAAIGAGVAAVGAVAGGLMARFKKKKEERKQLKQLMSESMKWLDEFRFASYIENIKRDLDNYFKNLDRELSRVDKRIAKLNTEGSSFDASKAIRETEGKLEMLNKAIATTVSNNNSQIAAFANEANQLEGQLRGRRKWKAADWDKWKRLVEIREKIIPEIQRASADQVDELMQQQIELNDELANFVEQQKNLIVSIGKETSVASAGLAFGDDGESLMSEIIGFQERVRDLLLTGLDPAGVNTIIENEKRKLDQTMQEQASEFADALKDAQQSLADEILGINDEMLGVLDEGRTGGFLKATNQDKINQLADKLKTAREGGQSEVTKLNLDEEAFKKRSEFMVSSLNSGIQKVFDDVKQGLTEISNIQVVVNDPKFIASEVERIWKEKQQVPSFLTRAI